MTFLHPTRPGRWFQSIGVIGLLVLSGCASFEESGWPGSASAIARDKMMVVQQEPETFGYYRILSLVRAYPEMDGFLRSRGLPDFLTETEHGSHEYMILYYLRKRRAYACQARYAEPRRIQFYGPYPITDGEMRQLQDFLKDNP